MTKKPQGSGIRSALPLASKDAPFIYFDNTPNYGVNTGVASITLEVVRHTIEGGQISSDRVTVAHLRCGTEALQGLKQAIAGIEALLQPQPQVDRTN